MMLLFRNTTVLGLLICFLLHHVSAQSVVIHETFEWVQSDHFGNCYLKTPDNVLIKYDKNGEKLSSFSSDEFGEIHSIDASDPMKILIYFLDQNVILFLNNELSPIGSPIDLNKHGFFNTIVACQSNVGGFWIFDLERSRLFRLDKMGTVIAESIDLKMITGKTTEPSILKEYDSNVFLYEPETGVFLFDVFGTWEKSIPINNLIDFQVFNNNMFFFKDNSLSKLNLFTMNEELLMTWDEEKLNVLVEKFQIFVISENFIEIYPQK